MAKIWKGRTDAVTDSIADDFNSSIRFDKRMFVQDIKGSMAHADMLGHQGIIEPSEAGILINGLEEMLEELLDGRLVIDETAEDIHSFVEQELTRRVGDTGKKLHTARSRNDQVALDIRLFLRDETQDIILLTRELIAALTDAAEKYMDAIMPGYTHLQRAQPILFSHQLMAYAWMFLRDTDRLTDCLKRINVTPIGSCALAGTTYNTDREYEAGLLGFDGIMMNSLDGVSDRDFAIEFLSNCAILMMHLSRFSEELILWTSWEFKFVTLSDAYTTGSSIMPQKKNSDMAELIRGKTGRVYGDLMSLLTVMKGIPLAYDKDMQEDKEPVFDAIDTVKMCLKVAAPMIRTMNVHRDRMLKAARQGFINATDLADYLTKKGMPFRTAYQLTGQIVADCIEKDTVLEDLSIEEYRAYDALFEEDLYEAIDLGTCVATRTSKGGTSPESVKEQIDIVRKALA